MLLSHAYENIQFWENDIKEDYLHVIHSASYFEKKVEMFSQKLI